MLVDASLGEVQKLKIPYQAHFTFIKAARVGKLYLQEHKSNVNDLPEASIIQEKLETGREIDILRLKSILPERNKLQESDDADENQALICNESLIHEDCSLMTENSEADEERREDDDDDDYDRNLEKLFIWH